MSHNSWHCKITSTTNISHVNITSFKLIHTGPRLLWVQRKDLLILTFFLYTNISTILNASNCSRIRIWDTLGAKLIPAVYSVVFDLKGLISRHLRYGIRLAGMVIHTRQSTEHFGEHQQCNNAGRLLERLLSWQVFHYGRWQGGPAIWYTSLLPLNCLQGNTRATKGSLTSITNSGLGIGLGGGAKEKKLP
jgi:hypothetical protein